MEFNDNVTKFSEIKNSISEFERERKWDKCRNPKDLSMSIAIEAAELMEIFQWDTSEEAINIKQSDKFDHFKEEVADVLIYSISLASSLDLDISTIIKEKLIKNAIKYPCKN